MIFFHGDVVIRALFFLLCFFFPVNAFDITVCGTGFTGISTAYAISTELEKVGVGEGVTLHVVGKWDWQAAQKEASEQEITAFEHETSGWGPLGLQLYREKPWNYSDGLLDQGHYFISNSLSEEEKRIVDLFNHWHINHLSSESERMNNYLDFNAFCCERWHLFKNEHPENPFDLSLHGCWVFRTESQAKEMLEQLPGIQACLNTEVFVNILPFWSQVIKENKFVGLFFPEDGMVDSQKLRSWMWGKLLEKRGGKPAIVLHQSLAIERLLVTEEGVCQGIQFEDGSILQSDIVILATGYGTKALVDPLGIDLPLGKLWGFAMKAQLTEAADNLFAGPIGTCTYRLFTMINGGKNITAATPFSCIVPENSVPSSTFFKEQLRGQITSLFKDRLDTSSIRFVLAPRVFTPDELPIIDLEQTIPHLMVLLPTYHLGLTQSLGIGHLAAQHLLKSLGKETELLLPLKPFRLDRFKK